MADVFISYSKSRAAETERLAKALSELGYDVWWDHILLPTGPFEEQIRHQLNAAKAVIVIWSPESVTSRWVSAEAARGDRLKKLVSTRTSDLDPAHQLPLPFDQIHSVSIENLRAIVAALDALQVPRSFGQGPSRPTSAADLDDRLFSEVEKAGTEESYAYYLDEMPEGRHAALAKYRLKKIRPISPLAPMEPALHYPKNPKPVRLGKEALDRVFLMIGNHTDSAEISIRYHKDRIKIPAAVRPVYVELAEMAKERAKNRKQPYFNGPNTRLLCVSQEKARQLQSGQEAKGWVLEVGPVSWEEYTVLNASLDERTLAGGDTIRRRFADENTLYNRSPDLRWCQLSNILCVCMVPITTDGYGLIQHRSLTGVSVGGNTYTSGVAENIHRYLDEALADDLSFRLNSLTEPSAVLVDQHYQPHGVPSPLLTAQRGVLEELSEGLFQILESVPERFKFLNVIMSLAEFHPYLVGVIELPLSRAEVERHIQESPGKDHSEFTTIEYLALDPDNMKTAAFISDHNRWTMAGLSSFITSIAYWKRIWRR